MVSIITDLISKKQVLQLNHSIKDSINTVKDELEDHLTAINENTNEIESNYELIAELAIKLEKIEERLEQVELILHSQDIEKQKVDELNIGADLKGKAATEIMISGPGFGKTQPEAMQNALENMKRLQTILITGSLPVKLNVVKTDQISPRLGKAFVKNAWFIALLVGLAITLIIVLRYKRWELSVPLIVTLGTIKVLGLAGKFGFITASSGVCP